MLTSPSYKLTLMNSCSILPAACCFGAKSSSLRRQSFEVLRYLAEHAGEVVSSDELIDALWPTKPADTPLQSGNASRKYAEQPVTMPAGSSKPSQAAASSSWQRSVLPCSDAVGHSLFNVRGTGGQCRNSSPRRMKVSRGLRPRPGVHFGERVACLPSLCPACSSPVPGCSGRGGTPRPVKACSP